MKRLAPVFSAFIFAAGCGDDSGSLPNVSGVWSGSYSGALGTAAGSNPKGFMCLEISQGGATLYGKGFICEDQPLPICLAKRDADTAKVVFLSHRAKVYTIDKG